MVRPSNSSVAPYTRRATSRYFKPSKKSGFDETSSLYPYFIWGHHARYTKVPSAYNETGNRRFPCPFQTATYRLQRHATVGIYGAGPLNTPRSDLTCTPVCFIYTGPHECTEDEVGEAGALSISTCNLSFNGRWGCSVNDTVFTRSHVARKGAVVAVGSGQAPSLVEFHRCTVTNSTSGVFIKDDPQGEGGVFSVAPGNTILLSNSTFEQNRSGNKVYFTRSIR